MKQPVYFDCSFLTDDGRWVMYRCPQNGLVACTMSTKNSFADFALTSEDPCRLLRDHGYRTLWECLAGLHDVGKNVLGTPPRDWCDAGVLLTWRLSTVQQRDLAALASHQAILPTFRLNLATMVGTEPSFA